MPFLTYVVRVRSLALFAIAILAVVPASAQETDTAAVPLPELRVEAVRETETAASVPYAVSFRHRSTEEVSFTPALELGTVLTGLPGLQVDQRGHFALGERISVRGVGLRAPFGTRGVQVIMDGVPLTIPDGQAVTEVVEPMLVRRVELVRGPAALFWGNASGGVLFLDTAPADEAPRVRLQTSAGSYGRRNVLGEAVGTVGRHRLRAYASHARRDGYREYSSGFRSRTGVSGTFELQPSARLHVAGNVVHQDTQHPGALNADQIADDPRQARPGFAQDEAGKVSTQAQAGTRLDAELPVGRLDAAAYGLVRHLENPLPFAFIQLDRGVGGLRLAWHHERGRLSWSVGADAALQHDQRENWNIVSGEAGDQRELDQTETVSSAATFGTARFAITDRLALTTGLRLDRIRFEMDDQLVDTDDPETMGDQSGSRTFQAWSPSAGVSYRRGATLLFASVRTGFETPTTTELVNRPDGMTGGFNPRLEPQRLYGAELGTRALLTRVNVVLDAAVYVQRLDDALVQVGTDHQGRAFFGNAAQIDYRGVELAAEWTPSRALVVRASYTASHFRYASAPLEGSEVPGASPHRGSVVATIAPGAWWLRAELEAASRSYVSDANDATAPGYAVLDARAGYELDVGTSRLAPFVAVTNILDRTYYSSLIVNDTFGRYYEPAPGRAFSFGISLFL